MLAARIARYQSDRIAARFCDIHIMTLAGDIDDEDSETTACCLHSPLTSSYGVTALKRVGDTRSHRESVASVTASIASAMAQSLPVIFAGKAVTLCLQANEFSNGEPYLFMYSSRRGLEALISRKITMPAVECSPSIRTR